jgi:hypothetical protein
MDQLPYPEAVIVRNLTASTSSSAKVEIEIRYADASPIVEVLSLTEHVCRNAMLFEYLCADHRVENDDCRTLYDAVHDSLSTFFPALSDAADHCVDTIPYKDILLSGETYRQVVDLMTHPPGTPPSTDPADYADDEESLSVIEGVYRTIWMMWWQGWDNAPALPMACYKSWLHYNPTWNVLLLDGTNIDQFLDIRETLPHIDFDNLNSTLIASMTDVIRFGMLYEYGGVWVDATVLCHRPLMPDLWNLGSSADFFAFESTEVYLHVSVPRDRMIATWYLASRKGSYITKQMYLAAVDYWRPRSVAHTYFWANELFFQLYKQDPKFASYWDAETFLQKQPKTFFRVAHLLQLLMYDDTKSLSTAILTFVRNPGRFIQMSKLTHKYDASRATGDSVLQHVLRPFKM